MVNQLSDEDSYREQAQRVAHFASRMVLRDEGPRAEAFLLPTTSVLGEPRFIGTIGSEGSLLRCDEHRYPEGGSRPKASLPRSDILPPELQE